MQCIRRIMYSAKNTAWHLKSAKEFKFMKHNYNKWPDVHVPLKTPL